MERRLSRRACTERERHTYTDTWLVCVCVSQSKRENHPFPQEGGWEIEWPYIHKGENHPVPQGGGGEGMPQEAEHKTAVVGEGDAAEAEGYPVPQGKTAGGISCSTGGGGGRGEYTMTSITY